MPCPRHLTCNTAVALRKESVDRNPTLKAMRGDRKASLSARRAWIEMSQVRPMMVTSRSLSARRAWIEICTLHNAGPWQGVALRKESVDRNMGVGTTRDRRGVALRKESVDRNCRNRFCPTCQWRSLSARRAWIEIDVQLIK